MRFRNDDFPTKQGSGHSSELTDTIAEEHPKHLAAVAEEQIRSVHHHSDGSQVELHEVGSREFIQQSIRGSLEGKLTGNFEGGSNDEKQRIESSQNINAAKIEYEKKSSQQPQQLYGTQQPVTGVSHGQETVMMGCNCGAEWTVTGQSLKSDPNNPAAAVKVEQYGSAGGQLSGYRASGAGGEKQEYRTSVGQQQGYRG